MRKPAFCMCETKYADQLRGNRGNREADLRLCFRCTDNAIPLLSKSEIQASSLLWLYSLIFVGPGQKPRRQVFSQRVSIDTDMNCIIEKENISKKETKMTSRFPTRPRDYKTFLCSTQLSMKSIQLINVLHFNI